MKFILRFSVAAVFFAGTVLLADFARGYLDNLAVLQKDAKQYINVSESAKNDYNNASELMAEAEKEHAKGDYTRSTELARKSEQKFNSIIRTKGKGASKPVTKPAADQGAYAKKAEEKLSGVKALLAKKDQTDKNYESIFIRINTRISNAEKEMSAKNYASVLSLCESARKDLETIPDKTADTPANSKENDDVAYQKSVDKIRDARKLREEKRALHGGKSNNNFTKGDESLKKAEKMFDSKQYGEAGRNADDAKGFFISITGKKTAKEIQEEKRAEELRKKSEEAQGLIDIAENKKKNTVLKKDNISYIRAEEDLAKAKEFFKKGAYESAKSKAKQAAKKFGITE